MAKTTTQTQTQTQNPNPTNTMTNKKPPKPKLVCFSFAAYAKTLIHHLKSSNIPIFNGLSNTEFTYIETTFGFTFPPDLRSILCEGLPVGHGFPNWRSSSPQQLHILLNLPILGLLKQVSQRKFWSNSWGAQPDDTNEALALAKKFLDNKAPVLVPIYKHFYIPSKPNIAGNPVFYVKGSDVRVSSFDVSGFFQEAEFLNVSSTSRINSPAWTATTARRIEFWSEVAERAGTRWWSGDLAKCLEEVFWRLRDGGWNEEEVREMMMMNGGDDDDDDNSEREGGSRGVLKGKEGVVWHVRLLLRAGWTREDVLYSLGLVDENGLLLIEEQSLLDFQVQQQPKSCAKVDEVAIS